MPNTTDSGQAAQNTSAQDAGEQQQEAAATTNPLTKEDVQALLKQTSSDPDKVADTVWGILEKKREASAEAKNRRLQEEAHTKTIADLEKRIADTNTAEEERKKRLMAELGLAQDEEPDIEALYKTAASENLTLKEKSDALEAELLNRDFRSDFAFEAVENGYTKRPKELFQLCRPIIDALMDDETKKDSFTLKDVFAQFGEQYPDLAVAFRGQAGNPSLPGEKGGGAQTLSPLASLRARSNGERISTREAAEHLTL